MAVMINKTEPVARDLRAAWRVAIRRGMFQIVELEVSKNCITLLCKDEPCCLLQLLEATKGYQLIFLSVKSAVEPVSVGF